MYCHFSFSVKFDSCFPAKYVRSLFPESITKKPQTVNILYFNFYSDLFKVFLWSHSSDLNVYISLNTHNQWRGLNVRWTSPPSTPCRPANGATSWLSAS
jgi:hypothetical protein